MKKIILVILDGAADRPCPELGGKTPFQVAKTPHLDRLAKMGASGLLSPYRIGYPLPSDVSHFLLFGGQMDEFPGRGVFEALGNGVHLEQGDVTLAACFSLVKKVERELHIVERNPELEEEEFRKLADAIESFSHGELTARFFYTGQSFGSVVLTGEASTDITDSDPFYENLPVTQFQPVIWTEERRRAEITCAFLNLYLADIYQRLAKHPINASRQPKANILLLKWAGRRPTLPSFGERYGLKGVSIAVKGVMNGVAMVMGIDVHNPADTGHRVSMPFSDLVAAALSNLERYDFVHLHNPEPDRIAHRKDPKAKAACIEEADRALGPLVEQIAGNPEVVVAVTSDHATPSSGGSDPAMHCGEAVPFLLISENVRPDRVERFSEYDALDGDLGQLRGEDVLPILMNAADRWGNWGFRPTPTSRRNFKPTCVVPFRLPREGAEPI